MGNFIDLSGKRFGKLVAVERFRKDGCRRTYWTCNCDCGNTTNVEGGNLRSGKSKSCVKCQCFKHGLRKSSEYGTWDAMKQRCLNMKSKAYKNYGDRGIHVCERMMDFQGFLSTIGMKPSPDLTIDRIDNDGSYSCGECEQCVKMGWVMNVRWATRLQQANNQRHVERIIDVNGTKKTISEWEKISTVTKATIRKRIKRGWTNYEAVFGKDGHDENRYRRKSVRNA